MLGSILTRQYRVATRGIEIGLRVTHQAVDVAGGVVGAVAGHFGLANGDGETAAFTGEVVRDAEPGHQRPQTRPERPEPRRQPSPPVQPAPPPAAPPESAAPTPSTAAEASVPSHVSSEPVLVEESAEPGAEDGAGAQIRVEEPWPAYRHLKARDVIARLPSATREELAAVELFELTHANRKSVVVAAQRALKKASPPR